VKPPAAAAALVDDRHLDQLTDYVHLLATEGVHRGLMGPREADRLWTRHILNCAALAAEVPHGARVCDVGTGAGLPGVVLAITRPDVKVTLVDTLARRIAFLTEFRAHFPRSAEIIHARAEDLHGVRQFDVVTARAVARLAALLPMTMPLVARAGQLLVMKGAQAQREIDESEGVLRRMGCGVPNLVVIGQDVPEAQTSAVRVRWSPSR
jgi:16S rRNA (guanine527-N7)-methyltransferase